MPKWPISRLSILRCGLGLFAAIVLKLHDVVHKDKIQKRKLQRKNIAHALKRLQLPAAI